MRGRKNYVQMAVFKEISVGIKVLFICYEGWTTKCVVKNCAELGIVRQS